MTPAAEDPATPSPARMYDYLLGGTNNEDVDRNAVHELLEVVPEFKDGAEENRGFVRRASRYIAERGVGQFIDLGSGLPTANNTDEIVQRVNPRARVVLVDRDPLVLNHVAGMERDTVRAVHADIRHPRDVLAAPAMRIIDFTRPVGLLLGALMHFVGDPYDPYEVVRAYLDAVPSGSYLALSHINGDGQPTRSVRRIKEVLAGTPTGLHFRSYTEILRFFDGLELVPPELVRLGRWAYCGVGRKP